MGKRKLANWLDSWWEYTAPLPSPELWRKWSGIMVLSAAMERRLWIKTGIGTLYPNLYVVIVGPPGTGKTLLTSRVDRILRDVGETTSRHLHVAPASVTGASIIDELGESHTSFVHLPTSTIVKYNSLSIVSNELGVLLPEYDTTLMNKLTDVYDGFPYGERRRGKDINLKIEHPLMTMLAATTPSYLSDVLPEGAWDQGFMSRTLLAYSGVKLYREIFAEVQTQEALYKELLHDLRDIFEDYGSLAFTEETVRAIEEWAKAGAPPIPEHPKLIHYNTRRIAHMLKLCMVASLARGDSHTITLADYNSALDWLLELEVLLPDVFKSMVAGGDSRVIDDCWYYVFKEFGRTVQPLHEGRIVAFLMDRTPAHNVARVLDVMVVAGILIEVPTGQAGRWYRPMNRKPTS